MICDVRSGEYMSHLLTVSTYAISLVSALKKPDRNLSVIQEVCDDFKAVVETDYHYFYRKDRVHLNPRFTRYAGIVVLQEVLRDRGAEKGREWDELRKVSDRLRRVLDNRGDDESKSYVLEFSRQLAKKALCWARTGIPGRVTRETLYKVRELCVRLS